MNHVLKHHFFLTKILKIQVQFIMVCSNIISFHCCLFLLYHLYPSKTCTLLSVCMCHVFCVQLPFQLLYILYFNSLFFSHVFISYFMTYTHSHSCIYQYISSKISAIHMRKNMQYLLFWVYIAIHNFSQICLFSFKFLFSLWLNIPPLCLLCFLLSPSVNVTWAVFIFLHIFSSLIINIDVNYFCL